MTTLSIIPNSYAIDSDVFPTLSLAERDRRWRLVRDFTSQQGLDGLVVFGWGRNANDSYFTNEESHAIVLMTGAEDPMMFLGDVPINRYDGAGARYERWVENWKHGNPIGSLAEEIRSRGLAGANLGVVGLSSRAVGQWAGVVPFSTWNRVLAELPQVTWVDVADAFETLTLVKSAEEQEMVRKAASLGEAASAAYVAATRIGALESEVTAAAVNAIIGGGGWMRAPFILERAGKHRFGWGQPEWFGMGGKPHTLERGDSIASELFAYYGGFESQQQIDVVIGEPDRLLRELEEVCLESYQAGMAALRPGIRFSELAEIMDEPLKRSGTWNTGPMVQTVAPVIFNSATRINPGVDPALAHLPALPSGVGLDGDFEITEGVAFAFEPNALRDGRRVCIGGTVMLTDRGIEELNTIANRLVVVDA
ncbi:M24 family metallopeptidase [Agromyces sp. PvR057]|uniref:M24 family metallopeptidase n=1 Tax=Agromyces sp. PvR057 TaxID=3156403 RepID=UPI000E26E315